MPGLVQKNAQIGGIISSSGTVSENGIWSKHRGDVTFDQLQKFWNELSPQARQELLRIDKQTLFEQARKNLYCSRCNGLLLEGFSQIVMYGKSLYQEGTVQSSLVVDEVQDPSIHPWGGLATTRDGILTLLDCFLDGKSLKALQNVFDSARARERERELLYPDACGGGGRGWISQGVPNYGRGHGARETCALHTARFSCDTLVDFWLALGDESRQSLLRMKEEDFIERLMYRFDSKRFCRDCRRNVIREFKELKELKRIHREPHCTNWFCAADTAFQYEVSDDAIQADWGQSFTDAIGTYHHFEWAVGTGEGNSDILEFEDVGMNQSVQVNGLDLGDLISCFITLRAWKLDGRCTELSVKAHALKGKPCVHRRLIVGDGFVTITKGESITRFFEHAEEAEEEEDDDSIEKDGNDADGDGSRAQKHAKTPELAREFLLDAATVIFRDQVEKAFREGTARQNAHSIFVCLALKLLEERVHVACKEIITLEKQIKLLEEEEKEKREEEERKERRRTKEREKKNRRKERQKGKDKGAEPKQLSSASDLSGKESSLSAHMEPHYGSNSGDSIGEIGENMLSSPVSSDIVDAQLLNEFQHETLENDSLEHHSYHVDRDFNVTDDSSYLLSEQQSKFSQRKTRFRKDLTSDPVYRWSDRRNPLVGNEASCQVDESKSRSHAYIAISSRCNDGIQRQSKYHTTKSNVRSCGPKSGENFRTSSNKMRDRSDFHSCSCNQHCSYRSKEGPHVRSGRDSKMANKLDMGLDVSTRSFSRSTKFTHGCYGPDGCAILRGKILTSSTPPNKGEIHYKKVWEPMESRKKCSRSSSEPDVRLRSSDGSVNGFHKSNEVHNSTDEKCSSESSGNLGRADELDSYEDKKGAEESNIFSASSLENSCSDVYGLATKLNYYLNGAVEEEGLCSTISSDPVMSSSSSDNCSSCHSEGDNNTASSGAQNAESLCTSDSEDASQHSECREISTCTESPFVNSVDVSPDEKLKTCGQGSFTSGTTSGTDSNLVAGQPFKNGLKSGNGRVVVDMGALQPHLLPVHNQNVPLPVFSAPSTMGYYHQSPASWEMGHTNGLVPFPQFNRFVYTGPVDNALSVNPSSHFCVQYGETTQPMTAPAFNVDQLPLYHVGNKANCVNTNEQTRISKLGRAQRATSMTATIVSEHRPKGAAVNRPIQQKVPSSRQNGNPSKPHDGSPNFSLFHFGGPVAVSLKDEGIADLYSEWTGAPLHVDLACSKKETKVEEYSLFASSKGSRFSFF